MSVIYTRTYSTACSGALLDFINADVIITPSLEQIINDGTSDLQFQFASTLSTPEITQLDNILLTFSCPVLTEISTYSAVIDDASSGSSVLWSSTKIANSLESQDELSELLDVQLTSPVSTDILKFNGTKWINGPDFNTLGYTTINSVTSNYSVTLTDIIIICDGLITITLPAPTGISGKMYLIKNIGTQVVTINTLGGQIDGQASQIISTQYIALHLVNNGVNWFIV